MRIACPGCEAQFDVLNEAEGKVVNCPKCMGKTPVKSANTLAGPPWWAVLLVLFVIWVVFLAVSIFAGSIGTVMVVVFAALLTLTGVVMLIVAAFKEDVKHGILTMLVPFYALYYVITRFRTVWKEFSLSLAGVLFFITASIVIAIKPPPLRDVRLRPLFQPSLANQDSVSQENLDQLLAALNRGDEFKILALVKLERMPANPQHQQAVAARLAILAQNSNESIRISAIDALGVWGTPNEVPVVIGCMNDAQFFVQLSAFKALGRLRDERAIEPLTRFLSEERLHHVIVPALKKFGPVAEKQVLPLLKNADNATQYALAEILEAIGTTQSIPDLQVVATNGRGLGKHCAERAIRAIQAREKK